MPTFIYLPLILLFFHIFHVSTLHLSPLLALNNDNNSSNKTHFATLKTQDFNAFMQCRLDLNNKSNCYFSIEHAKNTILRFCPNANYLETCFDGRYLGYSHNDNHQSIVANVSNHTCSSKLVHDKAYFGLALETLLLTIKAKAKIIQTRNRFAYGEINYGGNGGKILGIVECLRDMFPRDCDNCLGKGIDIVQEQCEGKGGGLVVVEGQCLVWFRANCKFIIHSNVSHGGSKSSRNIIIGNMENNGDGDINVDHVKRGLMFLLGIGAVIVVIIGICGCLMRRSILNRSKVGTISGVEDDKV